jgi:hypothetical protein
MPTVFRKDGFRVVIYTTDHLPAHVHVVNANGEVRIALGENQDPFIMGITGNISDREVAKSLKLVNSQQAELLNRWQEIHG